MQTVRLARTRWCNPRNRDQDVPLVIVGVKRGGIDQDLVKFPVHVVRRDGLVLALVSWGVQGGVPQVHAHLCSCPSCIHTSQVREVTTRRVGPACRHFYCPWAPAEVNRIIIADVQVARVGSINQHRQLDRRPSICWGVLAQKLTRRHKHVWSARELKKSCSRRQSHNDIRIPHTTRRPVIHDISVHISEMHAQCRHLANGQINWWENATQHNGVWAITGNVTCNADLIFEYVTSASFNAQVQIKNSGQRQRHSCYIAATGV